MMLQRGDQIPHVELRTTSGEPFSYRTIWQGRNLVLVALPPVADDAIATELRALAAEFEAANAVCVVTRDPVPGLPAPAALVADAWGEIVHVRAVRDAAELPTARALLEWVDYLGQRCPECEGEAK
jgi:hypothetical protein